MSWQHTAFACAIGAGLGFDLSWRTRPELWWLGALVGGSIALLIAVGPQLPTAIRRSWQRTICEQSRVGRHWKQSVFTLACTTAITSTLMIAVVCVLWADFTIFLIKQMEIPNETGEILYSLILAYTIIWLVAWLCMTLSYWNQSFDSEQTEIWGITLFATGMLLASIALPLSVVVLAVWQCRWIAGELVRLAKFLSSFVKNCLRFIHTERPLLCFVDAAFMVALAHLLLPFSVGGDLAAAFLGGLLGPLHYHLVSVRWLGLHPRHQAN